MSVITSTPLQLWALAQHADKQTAYTAIAELVGLPTPEQVPSPGRAAGWDWQDWLRWGDEFGLRGVGQTKHQRVVEHQVWPRWRMGFATSSGDHRAAMNAARDVRQIYTDLMEFLRQAAVYLHSEGQKQAPERLAGWFAVQTTGESGQGLTAALEAQATKVVPLDTPLDAEINKLMLAHRKIGSSYRKLMEQAGLPASRADWVVMANRGRTPGTWGYGKEAQALLDGLRRLAGENEPEVLTPDTVTDIDLDSPASDLDDEQAPVAEQPRTVSGQVLQKTLKDMQGHVKTGQQRAQQVVESYRKVVASYRSRQNWLYKGLEGLQDLQKKMYQEVMQMESDPLFEEAVSSLKAMGAVAVALEELTPIADAASQVEGLQDKLALAERAKHQAEQRAKELEDQLTDPNSQAEQLIASFKKILTALSVSDFLQIAKGVELTKTELEQWIDKLQK